MTDDVPGTDGALPTKTILDVTGLGKTYAPPPAWLRPFVRSATSEPRSALRDVSFQLSRGEVVGLVGENGAGKTTLFRCLSGLLEWETGTIKVEGISVEERQSETAARVGVVLEGETGLYGRLTARQNLEFFGGLYGLSGYELARRVDELLEMVGLTRHEGLVFGLSSGMRVRLSIARALLTSPRLLLLDEPTRSLDAEYQSRVSSIVSEHTDSGNSVLLSSHDLHMILEICDRVLVLRGGELTHLLDPSSASVSMDELRAAIRGQV